MQGVFCGTASREHKDANTSRKTCRGLHRTYQGGTSRATVYIEGARYGNQPEGSAQGTCQVSKLLEIESRI